MKAVRENLSLSIKDALIDFFDLFFPICCAACRLPLIKGERQLCGNCCSSLPKTHFHELEASPLSEMFLGRVPIYGVWPYLRYTKGGKVQRLLHAIKYQNNQQLGLVLGRWFGADLKKSGLCQGVDLIVPLPLHRSRQHQRGYNQSDLVAEGISIALGVPWHSKLLERVKATETQTRKARLERWLNVATVFQLVEGVDLSGKSILLVDDVLTTGATLEAAAHPLVEAGARVSIATLAYAKRG